MWEKIREISFRFFGRKLEPYVKYFDSIKSDLQQSNIPLSLTEYIYVMFFSMLIVFMIEFPLIVVITSLIFLDPALSFLFSFTITLFIILGTFFMFYTYPSYIAGIRKKNIDATLPFATTYMASVASSGAPPSTMFRVLSSLKNTGR